MGPTAGVEVWSVGGARMLAPWHRPAGPEGRRFPWALFLHGFPGSEKSVDVQRALAERGVASVAPHFLGAWGSGGTYRFSTLPAQAARALEAAARLPFADPRRAGLFGFSMGGWAALELAARRPRLGAVCVVAPAGGAEMLGPRTREFLEKLSRPLRAPSPSSLEADFRRALSRRDPAEAAARCRAPLLVVHGEADEVVPVAVSRRVAAAAGPRARLALARGAGHSFLDRRAWLTRLCAGWLSERLGARLA